MPTNLSEIILAVGDKVRFNSSWFVPETDVINDLDAGVMPKLCILTHSNGLFVPVSVDTDWASFNFAFCGTYRTREAARRNASSTVSGEKAGRSVRMALGGLTLGALELITQPITALMRKGPRGYVLDSFAYYSVFD